MPVSESPELFRDQYTSQIKKMIQVCSKTHTYALASEDYVKSEVKVSM